MDFSKIRFLFILVLSLLFADGAAGNEPLRLMIRSFTAPKDLPNEVVRDVIMDRDSSVWVATWGGGLVRLRGSQRDYISTTNGLISNDIRVLREDRDGRVWVGTSAGISCIESGAITNFSSQTVPEIPSGDSIFAIESLHNGEVWFGDGLGRLFAWTPSGPNGNAAHGRWRLIHSFSPMAGGKADGECSVRRIRQAPDRSVWLAVHYSDVYRFFSPEDNRPTPIGVAPHCFDLCLLDNSDRAMVIDYKTVGEIYPTGGRKSIYGVPSFAKCVLAAFGRIFVGTEHGLYYLDNKQLVRFSLTEDGRLHTVESLSLLRDGSLWVGTRNGIYRLSRPAWSPQSFTDRPVALFHENYDPSFRQNAFALDQAGRLWTYRDHAWQIFHRFERSFAPTYNLYAFAQNLLIQDTTEAIEFDTAESKTIRQYPTEGATFGGKYQIFMTSRSEAWYTEKRGIIKWDGSRLVPALALPSKLNPEVFSILETTPGEYWIGGKGWLGRYRDGQFQTVSVPQSCLDSNDSVLSILQTRNGELWFSLLGRGILRYKDGQWRMENQASGLPSNYIGQLFLGRDETIWAGDRVNGVMSYKDGRWIGYDYGDGIPLGTVTAIVEAPDGSIWIGLEQKVLTEQQELRTVYRYQPDGEPPSVEMVSRSETLVPGAQGVFSFRGYDPWNDTKSEDLVYSWRIVKRNTWQVIQDWSVFSLETSALTPQLRPGNYIFEVVAQDRHRNTSPSPAQAVFQVDPYFWMTLHFQLPIASASVSTLILLFLGWRRYCGVRSSEMKYKSMVEQDTHTLILHWDPSFVVTYANECAQRILGVTADPSHPSDVRASVFNLDSETQSLFHDAVNRAIQSPGSNQQRHLLVKGADRSPLWISWLIRAVRTPDHPFLEMHAFGTDITRQKQTESELHQERIGFSEFCEATRIGVYRLSRSGTILSMNSSMRQIIGWDGDAGEMPGADAIPWLNRGSYDQFIESLFSRQRVQPLIAKGRHVHAASSFYVLLYGVLKDDWLEIMALDLTQQKRLEKEIVSASTREQQKLGRDLHDSIVQELTGISYLGQILLERFQKADGADAQQLQTLVTLIDETRVKIRKISKGLSPVNWGKLGFQSALQELVLTIQKLYPVAGQFDYDPSIRIRNPEAEIHLYHIAHEALNNAAKHARARNIHLRLYTEDGGIVLTVRDDGIGMASPNPSEGMGLQIMRMRASLILADLHIDTLEEGGTAVSCRYSLDSGDDVLNNGGDFPASAI